MEPQVLIGLTGRARVGKDTVAEILLGAGFVATSFAGPIRQFVAELSGLTVEQLTDGVLKETPLKHLGGKSPRQLMQTLGTEWGRQMVDPDLWLNTAMNKVDQSKFSDYVITDVRFDNEAKAIRDRGGVIWHITRPGTQAVNAHSSEDGITPELWDLHLDNDGDLSDLSRKTGVLLQETVRRVYGHG